MRALARDRGEYIFGTTRATHPAPPHGDGQRRPVKLMSAGHGSDTIELLDAPIYEICGGASAYADR